MNDFIRPQKLSEALNSAQGFSRKKVKVYFAAGTTDLYVQMKDNALSVPNVFIDISALDELKKISTVGNSISIGAGATFREIINNSLCKKYLPLLVESAREIGSPLIRNRATLGGNIANSSPAGDSIPPLVALGASAVLRLGKSTRKVPIEKFFTGPKKNILNNGELIEKVLIPKNNFNFHKFLKLGSRKSLAISKISLAVTAKITNGKVISDIKIAAGAAGPTVIRCRKTEEFLTSSQEEKRTPPLTPKIIAAARELISSEILPIDDFRSTARYRRQAAAGLLEEILLEILS